MASSPAFDWAGASGQAWLAAADRLEAMLEPVSDALFERAALRAGESVLDVGCGRGSTTRRAASIVGPGRVIGLDIAADLLDAAAALDDGSCEWRLADAQSADLSDVSVDVVMSRFGVMFFGDPLLAFVNLFDSTKPGGRLCMAVWQTRDHSPYQHLPMEAARARTVELGLEAGVGPVDAGPFSLGVEERTCELLTTSGWTDIGYERITLPLAVGGPGSSPESAAATQASIGPFGAWMSGQTEEHRAAILEAMAGAFAPYATPTGVVLDGGIVIVTAAKS